MYDADYEDYLNDMHNELKSSGYFTKDSGKRAQHSDGVVRDTDKGKTKFTLIFPEGVPMDQQLIVRIAELYTRGGEKYGDRNWENSKSADTLKHHTDALWRHFMNFFFDVQDGEDHAAAIFWNINAVELCRRNLVASEPPGKDPFKSYTFPYIGKDTCLTGRYQQKEILAENYTAAKKLFDSWYASQPHYFIPASTVLGPVPHPDPLLSDVPTDLEWAEGDVLEEVKQPLDDKDDKAYTWVYDSTTDTWKYQPRDGERPTPESARSLKRLRTEFGPLKCTKGSHAGRIIDGA